jgi:cytochrome c
VWTEKQLDAFLKAPRDLCPGTAMDFNGVVSAQERNSIIGYLRTLHS